MLDSFDMIPPRYFISHYAPLCGRDWIKRIPVEERKALCHYAFACSDYGRKGGIARATKAKRYPKGHPQAGQFAPN